MAGTDLEFISSKHDDSEKKERTVQWAEPTTTMAIKPPNEDDYLSDMTELADDDDDNETDGNTPVAPVDKGRALQRIDAILVSDYSDIESRVGRRPAAHLTITIPSNDFDFAEIQKQKNYTCTSSNSNDIPVINKDNNKLKIPTLMACNSVNLGAQTSENAVHPITNKRKSPEDRNDTNKKAKTTGKNVTNELAVLDDSKLSYNWREKAHRNITGCYLSPSPSPSPSPSVTAIDNLSCGGSVDPQPDDTTSSVDVPEAQNNKPRKMLVSIRIVCLLLFLLSLYTRPTNLTEMLLNMLKLRLYLPVQVQVVVSVSSSV